MDRKSSEELKKFLRLDAESPDDVEYFDPVTRNAYDSGGNLIAGDIFSCDEESDDFDVLLEKVFNALNDYRAAIHRSNVVTDRYCDLFSLSISPAARTALLNFSKTYTEIIAAMSDIHSLVGRMADAGEEIVNFIRSEENQKTIVTGVARLNAAVDGFSAATEEVREIGRHAVANTEYTPPEEFKQFFPSDS